MASDIRKKRRQKLREQRKSSARARKHPLWMLGAATCLSAAVLPGLAISAESDATQGTGEAASADTSSGLQELIVTATRREQSVQKVPISIQALTPQSLEEHQANSFSDYVNMLPSVSYSTLGPGRTNLYFRGISVAGGTLPTVGVYLDDIPMTTSGRMPEVHAYDVERVEALAGPQGTLFGSSSLAGTLRIITQKPDFDEFKSGVDLQFNKFGEGSSGQMIEGFVNVPVNEHVAVRLMGYSREDGGYIDNTRSGYTFQLGDNDPNTTYAIDNAALVKKDYNPMKEYGARLAVGIDLGGSWTATPSITYQNLDAKGSYNYDPDFGDLVVHDFSQTFNKDEWSQASLTVQGRIADFEVVSATGYFDRRIRNANDYTYYSVTYDKFGPGYESYLFFRDKSGNIINPTQAYLGNIRQRKVTQELRVSVPRSWPFTLTLGGFYQAQKNLTDSQYYIPGLGQIDLAHSCGSSCRRNPAVKGDAFYLIESDATFDDYAVFSEGSYELLPDLTLTAGLRLFRAENLTYGFNGVASSLARAGCSSPLPAERLTCVNTNIPFKEKGETHKVSFAYQLDPTKMLYATYSTGYRPGGGNRIAPNNPYESDTLSNYELGFKATWGGIFRLNGAVYYEDWAGVQYQVVPFGFQGAGLTLNAGDASVYGLELDAALQLGAWSFSVSGAYNDAALAGNFCKLDPATRVTQIANCTDPSQIAAADGTRLPRQPKVKAQGTVRYEFKSESYKPYVQGTTYVQTSSTSNLDSYFNSLLGNTGGFTTFDLSAGVKHGGWSVEAFVQNAFDKRGALSKNTFCNIQYCHDSSRTYPIKPQYFGVSYTQRF